VSRHFDDLDAVLESDALDDLWQLVFAVQSPPCFRGGSDELEHHELGGLRRQGSLRSARFDDAPWRTRSRSGSRCAIVEHERGYRSQFAKIISLDYGDPNLLEKFRLIYRVNPAPTSIWTDFIKGA
jgi:hypothetical protein